jgi:hypothetical protein
MLVMLKDVTHLDGGNKYFAPFEWGFLKIINDYKIVFQK